MRLLLTALLSIALFACQESTPKPDSTITAEDRLEIIKPINMLFDGMRAGDSTMVAAAFLHRNPGFGTITKNREGKVVEMAGSLPQFLVRIAEPRDEMFDEQIYNVEIMQDGLMAMAWTPYKFYVGEDFSHCGVNLFTLAKTENGWKITSVTDTRRKDDCL